jgi:hypothetical protein
MIRSDRVGVEKEKEKAITPYMMEHAHDFNQSINQSINKNKR